MKKLIKDRTYTDILEYNKLGDIKLALDELIEHYGKDAELDIDSGHSSLDVNLDFWREETDKEYEKRIQKEAKDKQTMKEKALEKEQKERHEYERLKKKYG